jgi:hypothetical protein
MLSDVLGVLIAFVSIILLLSIVVTGLVQATQAVFRVRGRNLLTSVARFLKTTGRVTGKRSEWRKQAAAVLNSGNVAVTDKRWLAPDSILKRELLGPTVSWVHARELAAAIKAHAPGPQDLRDAATRKAGAVIAPTVTATTTPPEVDKPSPANESSVAVATGGTTVVTTAVTPAVTPAPTAAEMARAAAAEHAMSTDMPPPAPRDDYLVEEIRRAEPAWCKRFQFFMRMVTIVWAVVVAVGFQVSAPELFASLSNDPKRVETIVNEQGEVVRIAEEAIREDQYDLVSDQALETLAKNHPDYQEDIFQAANAAPTKAELLEELENVLPDDEMRPVLLNEYSALIDRLVAKERDPTQSIDDATNKLAAFGITWWKGGWSYYYDDEAKRVKAAALIGVLITALLLTFGAPFWFEQLRTLAALRDPRSAAASKRREREIEEDERNRTDKFVLVRESGPPPAKT